MLNYKDEHIVEFKESDSEEILQRLVEYLSLKKEGSIAEYILDFCESNEYRIEEIAYLIKEHKELKTLLKQDCIFHGIFKNKAIKVDSW